MTPAQWLAILAILEVHLPHAHPLIRAVEQQWQQARAQHPTPTQDQDQEQPPWQ